MGLMTRRDFVRDGALVAAAVGAGGARRMYGAALGLPLGLQLYSVREYLPKDFAGTLRQIAALGYREVEAAGFYGRTAVEVKQAMQEAGLRCVSAHYSANDLYPAVEKTIEYGKQLGLEWIVCSFPAIKDPGRLKGKPQQPITKSFVMEDFRYNAEKFNAIGEKVKAAGMQFAYHNHTMEFQAQDGVVPFDELMKLTDPARVSFELDTGWVVVGGGDPVALLKRYASRIKMLHVKDFKAVQGGENPTPAELGQGTLDIHKILAAARGGNVRHCFVEQEAFDVPWVESLKMDAEYMRKA